MARIRTIKPEFWVSEQVVECSTTARLLFIGLWNFCDDAGRHPLKPRTIKMKVFPADDIDCAPLLAELADNGLIETYDVKGEQYLQVTGWNHQKIEKPTVRFPSPSDGRPLDDPSTTDSTTPRRPVDDPSPPEGKGREGNRKGSKQTSSPDESGDGDSIPFETFWQRYPRKEGKAEAAKVWKRMKPADQEAAFYDSASRYAHVEREFIPHGPTYLRGRRWEDAPLPNKRAGPSSASQEFPGVRI